MKTLGGSVSALALAWGLAFLPNSTAAAAGQAYAEAADQADDVTAALNLASLQAAVAALRPSAAPESASPGPTPSSADPMATAPAASAPPPPAPPGRRDINPYDRDIPMTVPLNFNSRVLGELPVVLTRDDRFIVESAGFKVLIDPLLTPEAQAELAARIRGIDSFAPEEINDTGISLDYDAEQLAVLVLRIDPTKRSVESLFRGGRPGAGPAAKKLKRLPEQQRRHPALRIDRGFQ